MSSTLAKRLLTTALAIAVSIAVLWWLLADGMGPTLIDTLGSASLWPLILGALIAIAIQIIRAWRFAILVDGSLALPSWIMIGIATKLVLFNFLLPFKLGELSFPLMMKRAFDTPFVQGAGILILCRLFDLGMVTALILLTAAWLLDPAIHGWNPFLISAVGVVALATPLLITDRLPWLQRLTARWPRIADFADQMSNGAQMVRPIRQRQLVSALTISIWIAHAIIAWLVAVAINAKIGFMSMAMASASSNLAFALPISGVAGLGPPQAAWATMLRLSGRDWAPAIASALLCHGLLLITLLCFGIALWVYETLQTKPLIDKEGSASSSSCR